MRVIWKHHLKLTDHQTISMPSDSRPLSVQIQGENICVWMLTDTDAPEHQREFRIVGTGREVPASAFLPDYIGTVQSGGFVWHVFTTQ